MQNEFTIRKASRGDAPTIHELHTASVTTLCRTHYSPDLISRWLENRAPEGYYQGIDKGDMFVCEFEGNIVGFGHAAPGEILAIFVHPDRVCQGVGSFLLSHGLELARRGHRGPIKLIASLNAQAFYEKHGFTETMRYSVKRNNVDIPVVEMELTSTRWRK
jgi:GNAT superfamily N-acetyltransferase